MYVKVETPISKLTIGIIVLVMYVMTEPEAPIATVLSNIVFLIGNPYIHLRTNLTKHTQNPEAPNRSYQIFSQIGWTSH